MVSCARWKRVSEFLPMGRRIIWAACDHQRAQTRVSVPHQPPVIAAVASKYEGQCGTDTLVCASSLIRVLVLQPVNHGHEEDLQVEQERPVLDVVEVVLDADADRSVAAPAVDLGPAGDAGADF